MGRSLRVRIPPRRAQSQTPLLRGWLRSRTSLRSTDATQTDHIPTLEGKVDDGTVSRAGPFTTRRRTWFYAMWDENHQRLHCRGNRHARPLVRVRPDQIVHLLTAIPATGPLHARQLRPTNELRIRG